METDEMLDNSPLKVYSSELASQDKMIIRIKKQEPYVDIEGKDSSSDSDEVVSYTCEFVQKNDENKSETDDLCDEPIESIRQDDNFIYPAITHSDEDTDDITWQPPLAVLTPEERVNRKHIKCLYPKVEKPQPKKKKLCKTVKSKTNEELSVKRMKKGQALENINVSKPVVDFAKPNVTTTNDSITKKVGDSPPSTKVRKPRKGMATPKQRLGRILKIHKMMK